MVLLEGSKVVGSNMGLVSRGPVFSTGSVAPCLASGLGFSGGLGFWGPRGPSCRLGVFKGSLRGPWWTSRAWCPGAWGLGVPTGSVTPCLALWLGSGSCDSSGGSHGSWRSWESWFRSIFLFLFLSLMFFSISSLISSFVRLHRQGS